MQVLEPYDSTKSFPVFGFGGIPRHLAFNTVAHCFAINGNPAAPDIYGVQNIIQTYRQTLPNIGLGGPTYFAPLLQQFKGYVAAHAYKKIYQIMLLLTDGIIHDMPETKRLLVDMAKMPCSVIIVGIGSADFTAMEELDGDGGMLTDDMGRVCTRDLVQFVVYNEAAARGDLAEQVLKEVPKQCVDFMESVSEPCIEIE